MTQRKSFTKTIFVCPVDGIVPQTEHHTHTFTLIVNGDSVDLIIINNGFMVEGVEKDIISTTKKEIIEKFMADEIGCTVRGDINELVDEFPDAFLQSMAYILSK